MRTDGMVRRAAALVASLLVVGNALGPVTRDAAAARPDGPPAPAGPVTTGPGPGNEHSGLPRMGRLEVVAISEPRPAPRGGADLLVTARDARGLGAVEVEWGDDRRRIEGGGQRFLTAMLHFPEWPARAPEIVATAIGLDGQTRGENLRRSVLVTNDPVDTTRGLEPSAEYLERLRDTSYPARVGAFADVVVGPARLVLDQRPWWTRWMDRHGPVPFDYKAACGDYVASRGITPFGEVLECWLGLHPNVAANIVWHDYVLLDPVLAVNPVIVGPHDDPAIAQQALVYADWSPDTKLRLYQAFYWAWAYLHGGAAQFSGEYLPPLPTNIAQPPPPHVDRVTVIAHDDAWKLYLGTIAHSLALEIGGFVPWSIVNYDARDLEILFDSNALLPAGGVSSSLTGESVSGFGYTAFPILPAPATVTFEFLLANDLIRQNHYATIGRFLTWATQHAVHEPVFPPFCSEDLVCAEMIWGYRGDAPAARIMEQTSFEDPLMSALYGPRAWMENGCHGMTHFIKHTLRALNIPVEAGHLGGDPAEHANPFFWTIGHALSGGDTLFGVASQYTPPVPGEWLLIPMSTYDDWFVPLGDKDPYLMNDSRQRDIELPLKALSKELLQRYCLDEASGASHAEGTVAAYFVYTVDLSGYPEWKGGGPGKSFTHVYYDVAQLEALNLWTRLGAKAQSLGYCAPPGP